MNNFFQRCLEKGKIREFSRGKYLTNKEFHLAQEDLKSAKTSFSQKNFRWCIVQTYYSMFHAARALLYVKNYREKSHFCLIEAIRELYISTGKLSVHHLESIIQAKNLREAADYYGDYSSDNAAEMLKKSEDLLRETKKILSL